MLGAAWRSAWSSGLPLQSLGPLCALATVFVVAHAGGAADQGRFAQVKAWIDLLVVIGCFGFPQSIVYAVHKFDVSRRRLASTSAVYGLVFVAAAGLASLAWAERASAWTMAGAAGLLVVHSLWRGIYLTLRQGQAFAAFTVLPAVALLTCVFASRGRLDFESVFLLSAAPSALVGWVMLASGARGSAPGNPLLPWRFLFGDGAHAFVQSLLVASQPAIAYAVLRHAGGGDADVGFLHVGLVLVQGLSTPVSMAAPLLFARWTVMGWQQPLARLQRRADTLLALAAVAGLVLAGGAIALVPAAFGANFEPARWPAAIMMAALPLGCCARLAVPLLHAAGAPGSNTVAALVRWSFLVGAAGLLSAAGAASTVAIASAWALAEVACAGWTVACLRRLAGAPTA